MRNMPFLTVKRSLHAIAGLLLSMALAGCLGTERDANDPVPPIAILVAPEEVSVGTQFFLNASESVAFQDRTLTRFFWKNHDATQVLNLPVGTTIETSEPEVAVSFEQDQVIPPGTYRFELVVEDSEGNESEPAMVSVVVDHGDAPVAILNAPAVVGVGMNLSLDGGSSFAASPAEIVEYRWTYLDSGESMESGEPSLSVSVELIERPGLYRFRLVVVDSFGLESEPAEVSVAVQELDRPTAILDAPERVNAGVNFTLSGTNSLAASPAALAGYRWTSLTGDFENLPFNIPVETAEGSLEVQVGQESLVSGRHQFELVVVDDFGNESEPAIVEIFFVLGQAPVAVLTGPSTSAVGQSYNLSGADSTDTAPGAVVAYLFRNLDCANVRNWEVGEEILSLSPTIQVKSAGTENARAGLCTFQLVVEDDDGNESLPVNHIVNVVD